MRLVNGWLMLGQLFMELTLPDQAQICWWLMVGPYFGDWPSQHLSQPCEGPPRIVDSYTHRRSANPRQWSEWCKSHLHGSIPQAQPNKNHQIWMPPLLLDTRKCNWSQVEDPLDGIRTKSLRNEGENLAYGNLRCTNPHSDSLWKRSLEATTQETSPLWLWSPHIFIRGLTHYVGGAGEYLRIPLGNTARSAPLFLSDLRAYKLAWAAMKTSVESKP